MTSPPSEPCVRFSRTRLSSWKFLHRDWQAEYILDYGESLHFAKKVFPSWHRYQCSQYALHQFWCFHVYPCLVVSYTRRATISSYTIIDFLHLSSCLPSLWMFLLNILYHSFLLLFRFVFVFSVSSWFPTSATISSPYNNLLLLTVIWRLWLLLVSPYKQVSPLTYTLPSYHSASKHPMQSNYRFFCHFTFQIFYFRNLFVFSVSS